MGIIVCQVCNRTVDHVEDTKVRTLYTTCQACKDKDKKK
ncbi:GapA-binding peptide SR1P [Camelliibacillus cellulosilyticus]|uniref:GapA-binding peptide SR1P n=1 Tax=Camelliibacillus cellulosilyticus TaxID=2174486 RepID=A0ABV9GJE6_9BACL